MVRQQRIRPVVEVLEGRALLSGVVTEVEFNGKRSSSTDFIVPADGVLQLQGASVNDQDKDFFRFTATQSLTLNLNVQAANGVFAKLQVENAIGARLFETDPNNGVNSGSVALSAGATYHIRMRSPSSLTAAYLVDLGFGVDTPGGGGGGGGGSVVDESEFNGTRPSANVFSLDAAGKAQLRGVSLNKDDKDFFVLTPTQSGTLSVTVTSSNGVMAKLEAKDVVGTRLFETQPNDGVNSGNFQVVAGQKYFLRMRSPLDAAAGYVVNVTLT